MRVVITITVELAVAVWLFRLKSKNAVVTIISVNILTQAILNLFLKRTYAVFRSFNGWIMLIPLEIIIVLVEMLAYTSMLKTEEGQTKKRLAGYAFAANLCSFIVGILLSHLLD